MTEVSVSLPDDVLAVIDAEARARATTRGEVISLWARRGRPQRDPEAIQAATDRLREMFKDSGPFDSGELVRAERDWREQRDLER